MPRLKSLDKYPPEYMEVYKIAAQKGVHQIRCLSPDAASLLRANLYAYRRAVGIAPDIATRAHWEDMKKLTLELDGNLLTLVDKRRVTPSLEELRASLSSSDSPDNTDDKELK